MKWDPETSRIATKGQQTQDPMVLAAYCMTADQPTLAVLKLQGQYVKMVKLPRCEKKEFQEEGQHRTRFYSSHGRINPCYRLLMREQIPWPSFPRGFSWLDRARLCQEMRLGTLSFARRSLSETVNVDHNGRQVEEEVDEKSLAKVGGFSALNPFLLDNVLKTGPQPSRLSVEI
ncbi:hypothetical protein P154DRAFT_570992 [Amniculicola lignicola CBS 123094]|uniref:Uncharacterized protein n=1 Tax=Amniculicola lignicola CBS 123094 TaxID=1392246 RepID=A0A6A5WV58_9PLEO|nr:hypothetical protein P154DRAFT_570992 [Amniculicola lignicola CBS 123094]